MIWPPLAVACLVLLVHTFVVSVAAGEAEAAASRGLRAAWAAVQADDTFTPPPGTLREAAADAVAASAAEGVQGWRWWGGSEVRVYSDLCAAPPRAAGEPGWLRVEVWAESVGPLMMLVPDRVDPVYATAEGPARLALAAGAAVPVPADPAQASWRC